MELNKNLGIMLGRFTPTEGRSIQFYPSDKEIVKEFNLADRLGLSYIEWIITDTTINSFFKGYKEICKLSDLILKTGVQIRSVCLDYLMDLDLTNDENIDSNLIRWILSFAEQVDCKYIIIPIYKQNMDVDNISKLINFYTGNNLIILFEFLDAPSSMGIEFLEDLNRKVVVPVGVCFDIGNNCEKGVNNIIKELQNYDIAGYLDHIHIKEKDNVGDSCPLGTGMIGSKGWLKILNYLNKSYCYTNFTLQCSRGTDYKEEDWIRTQIEFLEVIYRNLNGR